MSEQGPYADEGRNPRSKASMEKAAMQDRRMQEVHAQLMREKDEPHEGFSPIPIFLLFIFAALCFWGGVYLVSYSGDFRWDAYDPKFVAGRQTGPRPEKPLPEVGARVFRSQCVACHQANGQGVPGVYPPLVGSEWVTGHQEVLARILINGLNGPIQVAGNTYNGNMPAFGPSGLNLKAREIAGVLTYIRQEWGNNASPVTEETIKSYLDDYRPRTTPWTADELRQNLSPEPEETPEPPPNNESQ